VLTSFWWEIRAKQHPSRENSSHHLIPLEALSMRSDLEAQGQDKEAFDMVPLWHSGLVTKGNCSWGNVQILNFFHGPMDRTIQKKNLYSPAVNQRVCSHS
jgi:hypothetical protein